MCPYDREVPSSPPGPFGRPGAPLEHLIGDADAGITPCARFTEGSPPCRPGCLAGGSMSEVPRLTVFARDADQSIPARWRASAAMAAEVDDHQGRLRWTREPRMEILLGDSC